MKAYNIIIDFDSTFMKVEALEELADIALAKSAEKAAVLEEIKAITNLGVDGKITFNESLTRRLALLRVHRDHLRKLVNRLKRKVSVSFARNKAFFKKYEGHIYIISNGFKDFIDPVVAPYGIEGSRVLANTFSYDEEGWVTGFDAGNPLAHSKGKSRTLKTLNLEGEIFVIGDAYTDFEMVEAGVAHKFFLFTENVLRENILPKADHVTPSFDEFLFVNQMPRALSFPKNRIRALLLNGVPEKAREVLEQEGYQVEILTGDRLETDFARYADKASILGVRAGVKVDRALLRHANRLMALAVFGAGTQAIDLEACTQRGIIVFNAPYTHTRSQVELAIGQMIMLLRRLAPHNRDMHAGRWRLAAESGFELRGKKLGIIGYGNSGQQLSVLAEALGMDVYYYDLVEKPALGNATKCERLKDLLRKADIVSLHVDNRPENKDFFGAKLFKHLREHAIFVNVSNGDAVDLAALAARLRAGQLRGAAIDVFPGEPDETDAAFHTPLSGLNNVVLTPHVGGATAEARQNSAIYVPSRVIDYVNTGNTFGAVNFPELQLPTLKNAHRLIHIHENQPGVLAQINQVLAEHRINILGQYLKTNDRIGYVITDIDKRYGEKVLEALKKVEGTIKFRVLY